MVENESAIYVERLSQDPIKRLKNAIKAGQVSVYLDAQNAGIHQPSDQYHLVVDEKWVRFALVEGQYPAQRYARGPLQAPSQLWEKVEIAQIAIPMRHALAGWYWNYTGGPESCTPSGSV